MGRGRKGVLKLADKNKKQHGQLPMGDRVLIPVSVKKSAGQSPVFLTEEVLKALGQMNPRDVANILVTS